MEEMTATLNAEAAGEVAAAESVIFTAEEGKAASAAAEKKEEAAPAAPAEDKKSRDLAEFRALFPEAAADPESIDSAVWQAVRGGRSLAVAYACHALAAAKAENETLLAKIQSLEKAAENARRSTGSLASAGSDNARRDAFTAGWNTQ